MAAYATWTQPILPQGENIVYIPPSPSTDLPQQLHEGPKCATRKQKKHGKGCAKNRVALDSVDIPVCSTWPTRGALCLSVLSAIAFTCALIFHGLMFYYALEHPVWVAMCWPFLLVPALICNSIYLAYMAKKVPTTPNPNLVYLYVVFATVYLAWGSYVIASTYEEGRCADGSYYSLVISILTLTTVVCALEWWLTVYKIMHYTAKDLTVTIALYEKSSMKRKLVITLKHNGKVIKECTYNMEKFFQDNNMNYSGQCRGGSTVFYNIPPRCGNDEHKQCPMKYLGQCSTSGSQFSTTACHYENEKLKQDGPMKYIETCYADGVPYKNGADQYPNGRPMTPPSPPMGPQE